MNIIASISSFDRYLSGLKLERDEHAVIQMHINKIRQEAEALNVSQA